MVQASINPARNETGLGLLMMTAAMLVVPIIDATAKTLSDSIPPIEVAWLRFAVAAVVLVPFVALRSGFGEFRQPQLPLHFLRGAGLAGATAFFFSAVAVMPLADVAAIFFVEPLILTLFSALFLGERIGFRRIAAVLVGFGGALLIIRPSFAEIGAAALLPLGAATCFAIYMTLTRKLAGDTDVWTLQALAGVAGVVTLGAAMMAGVGMEGGFVTPEPVEAAQIVAIGLIALFCHFMVIHALRRVAAGVIAPFQYLEIIGATLWGFVFFGEFPDAPTWIGIAIIVGSGIFVFHRERRA